VAVVRFPFAEGAHPVPWWSRPFGVTPTTSWVQIDDERLDVRFGPWRVSTRVDNVAGAELAGPYSWWKVAGPARWSFADHSLTFATRTDRGVEITFDEPVTGLDPFQIAHHPSLTVTVADPEALVRALSVGRPDGTGDT
jgi:hypothetical protein